MFWVVDSLTMRKHKKMTSLEGSRDCPKQVEVLPNDSNDEEVRMSQLMHISLVKTQFWPTV